MMIIFHCRITISCNIHCIVDRETSSDCPSAHDLSNHVNARVSFHGFGQFSTFVSLLGKGIRNRGGIVVDMCRSLLIKPNKCQFSIIPHVFSSRLHPSKRFRECRRHRHFALSFSFFYGNCNVIPLSTGQKNRLVIQQTTQEKVSKS
jgi:hypothetical protein